MHYVRFQLLYVTICYSVYISTMFPYVPLYHNATQCRGHEVTGSPHIARGLVIPDLLHDLRPIAKALLHEADAEMPRHLLFRVVVHDLSSYAALYGHPMGYTRLFATLRWPFPRLYEAPDAGGVHGSLDLAGAFRKAQLNFTTPARVAPPHPHVGACRRPGFESES